MLDAVRATPQWTTSRIKTLRALIDNTAERMKRDAPGIHARDLTELILVQPCRRIGNVVDTSTAKRQTASAYLTQRADIGLLREMKAGRAKRFIHPALIRALAVD